ncbi:MAG: response regulator transcription factor [Cyanobacteriota bacterium]|jgi:DNA-binding NarL/FixJ family response regulator
MQAPPSAPPLVPLTPAERRVLSVLCQGRSNRAIALELVVSHRTVEDHVSHLLAKTGCHNRSELMLWALGER